MAWKEEGNINFCKEYISFYKSLDWQSFFFSIFKIFKQDGSGLISWISPFFVDFSHVGYSHRITNACDSGQLVTIFYVKKMKGNVMEEKLRILLIWWFYFGAVFLTIQWVPFKSYSLRCWDENCKKYVYFFSLLFMFFFSVQSDKNIRKHLFFLSLLHLLHPLRSNLKRLVSAKQLRRGIRLFSADYLFGRDFRTHVCARVM